MKIPLMLFGLAVAMISTPVLAEPLVYVAAGSADKIVVIDAATDKVVGQFDNIDNPHSIVSTPDGEYVLSGSLKEKQGTDGSAGHSTIYLVHPDHGHVMLTMEAEGMIHHQTITPDGRYVISTHPTRSNISIVDLQQNRVIKTVATGAAPNYAVGSNDGALIYVSNSGANSVSVIDVASWTEVRAFDAGPGPEHMVLSKDGETLFVLNPKAGRISAITLSQGQITRTYEFGGTLHGLDISDNGKTLFVSSISEEKLIMVDPKTDIRQSLLLSPSPYHLETITGTGKVYVSSKKTPVLWVVDQNTGKLMGEIEIVGEGHQMTIIQ